MLEFMDLGVFSSLGRREKHILSSNEPFLCQWNQRFVNYLNVLKMRNQISASVKYVYYILNSTQGDSS